MNVFYIHTHDSGNIISPYGYKVPSPNIEAFSDESVMFRYAFSTAPTCSPSRTSLLTGQYPSSHKMIGLCNRNFKMNDPSKHLASFLGNKNYETVLCGIQHEGGHYNDSKLVYKDLGYQKNISTDLELKEMEDQRKWDDLNMDNTIDFLKTRDKEKNLFFSFGFFGTHRQFPEAEKDYRSKPPLFLSQDSDVYDDFNDYCASLENVDYNFGRLIETLKNENYLENSLIIFTSDHGIGFPFAKSNLNDAGIHVAFMVYHPKLKDKGSVSNALVSQVDIFPTICDTIDVEKPDWVQGKSLYRNLFEDAQADVNDEIYSEMTFHTSFEPARSIRTRRYKLIKYLDDYDLYNLSNINPSPTKEKYITEGLDKKTKERILLYDLLYDPAEKNNVYNHPDYTQTGKKLLDKLEKWRKEVDDPLLNDEFTWNEEWVVNKRSSITPSSKNPGDYVQGYIKKK